jgi:hypothetical protein
MSQSIEEHHLDLVRSQILQTYQYAIELAAALKPKESLYLSIDIYTDSPKIAMFYPPRMWKTTDLQAHFRLVALDTRGFWSQNLIHSTELESFVEQIIGYPMDVMAIINRTMDEPIGNLKEVHLGWSGLKRSHSIH